jgi:alkanesulfonate monooxygenase SsuD/methylene tetrahydromethanopterin reductase-like flavin-dependent oxidoreductase (luciferase family)
LLLALVQQDDPIQTAKLVAPVDQVSNGRFLFGVGGSWNQDEMEDHGSEFKTRFKLMRERIEGVKEIWTKRSDREVQFLRRVRDTRSGNIYHDGDRGCAAAAQIDLHHCPL